jgi:hypothetical protein
MSKPQPFLITTPRQELVMARYLVVWADKRTKEMGVEGLTFEGTWEGDEHGVAKL